MTQPHLDNDPGTKQGSSAIDTMVIGRLARVQTSMSHGVCLLIEAASGPILVPLAAVTQSALEHALQEARKADNTVIGNISSLSLH
jgi:hypothetical protein